MRSQVNQPNTRPKTTCAPARSVVLASVTASAEHQPQGVHQQMALAAFDPLAGVIAYRAAVTVGLDALAVENGGRGPRAFVLSSTDERAQRVVEEHDHWWLSVHCRKL